MFFLQLDISFLSALTLEGGRQRLTYVLSVLSLCQALLLLSVEGTALGKYFVNDARTYSIDTQNGDLTTELRMCEMQERSVSISSHPADPRTFPMSSAISA